MTYRQKYAAEHPERAEVVHHYECPSDGIQHCVMPGRLCKECWDREIDESGLNACPFCGSTCLFEDRDSEGWFVECNGCLAQGPVGKTQEEAESLWNRRR